MRCLSCNVILTSQEATRRGVSRGDFIDLCNGCFSHIRNDVSSYDNPLYADETETAEITDEAEDC